MPGWHFHSEHHKGYNNHKLTISKLEPIQAPWLDQHCVPQFIYKIAIKLAGNFHIIPNHLRRMIEQYKASKNTRKKSLH